MDFNQSRIPVATPRNYGYSITRRPSTPLALNAPLIPSQPRCRCASKTDDSQPSTLRSEVKESHSTRPQPLVDFPQQFHMWWRHSWNTYIDIGTIAKHQPVVFSAKLSFWSENLTLSRGSSSYTPSIGKVKYANIMACLFTGRFKVKLSNGATASCRPGAWSGWGRVGSATLEFAHNGRVDRWEWSEDHRSLGDYVAGETRRSLLVRQDGTGLVAAEFRHERDYSMFSSKEMIGFVEFDQAVMEGKYGPNFQVFAVMVLMRLLHFNTKISFVPVASLV